MRIKTGTPIDPVLFDSPDGARFLPVTAISTDSREVFPGDLFLALPGEKTDGADHVAEAIFRGASAVLSHRADPDPRVLTVPDPLASLTRVAKRRAASIRHKTVAVTGSYGKTTLRAALTTVLSPVFRLRFTEGNGNTDLAVALALLGLAPGDELLIAELGMRGRGEIARLSQLVMPDVAVITAIGTAHIGLLGSVDAIREAKCEIALGMNRNGVLLYPAGDERLAARVSELPVRSGSVSCDPAIPADYLLKRIGETEGETTVSLAGVNSELCDVVLPSSDAPTLSAAAFCFAVSENLGVEPTAIREGLSKLQPPPLRGQTEKVNGVKYILDCYNASPEPTLAALNGLKRYRDEGKRLFLVLGDMLELGELSDIAHETVGKRASSLDPARLYCVGESAKGYAAGALGTGLSPEIVSLVPVEELPKLAAALQAETRPGDVVFVKGSRALSLEQILQIIKRAVL